MLPSAHRLRRSEDFRLAIRQGVRTGRDTIVVHMTREGGDDLARAGLVVSKSIGNAVVRNGVKRRLRNVLRAPIAEQPPGTLLVVRALPPSGTASFQVLETEVRSAVRQASRKLNDRARQRAAQ